MTILDAFRVTDACARSARETGRTQPAACHASRRRRGVLGLLALAALLFACAGPRVAPTAAPDDPGQEHRLRSELERLAPDADPEEARVLANAIVATTSELAAEYRMVRPALLNNVFINLGLKQRGLCWHWARDLLSTLRPLQLEDFELHWGTAHPGRLFSEHNSVVVTARGAPFASGLVLDPWRESGSLYWIPVDEDHYPWQEHRSAAGHAPEKRVVDADAGRG